MNLYELTAHELSDKLKTKEISSTEITKSVIERIEKVEGTALNHRFKHINDTEDTAEIMLDFANGARGLFYATVGYVKDSPIFLEVVTEKAVFTLCNTLKVVHEDGSVETFENETVATGEKAYWGNAHTLLISDFYEKLHDGKPFWISLEEGAKCMRVLHEVKHI